MQLTKILRNPHCYNHTAGLGITHNASSAMNYINTYEPTNQEMTWFKGKAKNLHNNLHRARRMGQSSNLPPGYLLGGLSVGGMLLTGGLISLLILRK